MTTTKRLHLPTHVLHYESYTTDFNDMLQKLLEFWIWNKLAKHPILSRGKLFALLYNKSATSRHEVNTAGCYPENAKIIEALKCRIERVFFNFGCNHISKQIVFPFFNVFTFMLFSLTWPTFCIIENVSPIVLFPRSLILRDTHTFFMGNHFCKFWP